MNLTLAEDKIYDLAQIITRQLQPGDIISLQGELGAGKTTLARAMIGMLSTEKNIPSPTFSLVNYYHSDAWHGVENDRQVNILHVDFYRLATPDESDALDIFADNDAVIFIEWLERGLDRDALQLEKASQLWQIIIDDGLESVTNEPVTGQCRDYHIILPTRKFTLDMMAQLNRLITD